MDNATKKIARRTEDRVTRIDSYRAANIAKKFFEQYNNGVEIKDLELKDGVWFITVGVGFLFERIKIVEIDAYTGRIIQYR